LVCLKPGGAYPPKMYQRPKGLLIASLERSRKRLLYLALAKDNIKYVKRLFTNTFNDFVLNIAVRAEKNNRIEECIETTSWKQASRSTCWCWSRRPLNMTYLFSLSAAKLN